jgi:hypothetical protein
VDYPPGRGVLCFLDPVWRLDYSQCTDSDIRLYTVISIPVSYGAGDDVLDFCCPARGVVRCHPAHRVSAVAKPKLVSKLAQFLSRQHGYSNPLVLGTCTSFPDPSQTDNRL